MSCAGRLDKPSWVPRNGSRVPDSSSLWKGRVLISSSEKSNPPTSRKPRGIGRPQLHSRFKGPATRRPKGSFGYALGLFVFSLGGFLGLLAALLGAETKIAEESFPVSEIVVTGGSSRQATKQKGAAASAEPVRPLWSGRRKSRYSPNGFALLTAAPENGWSCGWFQDWSPPDRLSAHGPYPWSLSFVDQNMRRFSGKCSDLRHASM